MIGPTLEDKAWKKARPKLSVLIPFLRDDPTSLLAALDREAAALAGEAEIVILDDGTNEAALTERVSRTVAAMALPAAFLSNATNAGRARGRNRLAGHARGGWLLFLDSDMLPDGDRFLKAWLDLVNTDGPAVAFGGFSLDQTPISRAHALHRTMALRSDCVPVGARRLSPEKHVFTSNLLVRRDVFTAEAFDESFSGWGWEDVEWAMRVSRRWPIVHIDNTATHLGLDPAPAMAVKYEQSAANFARVVESHRDIVRAYPSYRVARALKHAPMRRLWRPTLKAAALAEHLPLPLRAFAMRLYRAALYAEAV